MVVADAPDGGGGANDESGSDDGSNTDAGATGPPSQFDDSGSSAGSSTASDGTSGSGSTTSPPGGQTAPDDAAGGDSGDDGAVDGGQSDGSTADAGRAGPPSQFAGPGGGSATQDRTVGSRTSPPATQVPPDGSPPERTDTRRDSTSTAPASTAETGTAQGGIADDVPVWARDDARQLQAEVASQRRGAVGPEDVRVTYADGELRAEVTEQGQREAIAADNPYADPEDVQLREVGPYGGTSPTAGKAAPDDVDLQPRTVVEFSEEAQNRAAEAQTREIREQVAQEEGVDPSQVIVERDGQQFSVRLSEQARREQLAEASSGVEPSDVVIQDGQVGLAEEARSDLSPEERTAFYEQFIPADEQANVDPAVREAVGDGPVIEQQAERIRANDVGQTTSQTLTPDEVAGTEIASLRETRQGVYDYYAGLDEEYGTAYTEQYYEDGDRPGEVGLVDVDDSMRNEQVSVPGFERVREPVQGAAQWWDENVGRATQVGAEYVTGSETVGEAYGGIARGVNPAGAADVALGATEAGAYTAAGAADGPGEVASRAGESFERGAYVAGRGVEAAQERPAQAVGMVAGGAVLGTAASAGARAGVSGARSAVNRARGRSGGQQRVGGTDIRSEAPDPWENVDPSRSLREQAGPDRGRVQQLAADARQIWRSDRGQAQIPRGRQRQRGGGGRRRDRGGTTESVRQDALTQYQDYFDDLVRRERAATERSAEPSVDPIGESRPTATFDPDAPRQPLRTRPTSEAEAAGVRVRDPVAESAGMLAAAQRQEVTAADTFDPQAETLAMTEQAQSGDAAVQAQAASVQALARSESVQEPAVTVDEAADDADFAGTGVGADVGQVPDVGVGERGQPAQDTRQTPQATPATTTDQTAESSLPPFTPGTGASDRPPTDRPPERGNPWRPRVPLPDPDVGPAQGTAADQRDPAPQEWGEVDRDLAPGWGAETLTVAADPGVRDISPSQSELEAEFGGVRGAEELPTQQMLEGDESVEAVGDLLGFGSVDADALDPWGGDDNGGGGWL